MIAKCWTVSSETDILRDCAQISQTNVFNFFFFADESVCQLHSWLRLTSTLSCLNFMIVSLMSPLFMH